MFQSQERSRVARFESPVATAALPPSDEPITGNPDTATLPMAVSLLLDLHNELPQGSRVRDRLRDAIGRAHDLAAQGIVLVANGQLAFDHRRFSIALWRTKQIKRAEAALDNLKKAVRDVADVNDYLSLERGAEGETQYAVDGAGLVPLPVPTDVFDRVNNALPQLLAGISNVSIRGRSLEEAEKAQEDGGPNPLPADRKT